MDCHDYMNITNRNSNIFPPLMGDKKFHFKVQFFKILALENAAYIFSFPPVSLKNFLLYVIAPFKRRFSPGIFYYMMRSILLRKIVMESNQLL